MQRWLILILLAGLTGCSAAPVQEPAKIAEPIAIPEPDHAVVPTSWRHAPNAEAPFGATWWKSLNDETLNTLVEQTMLNNPEIRVAEARLGEIERIAAEADPDEQVAANNAFRAASGDVAAIRQAAVHATVEAYLDTRLAEQRLVILSHRQKLERELTATLHKRLAAGIINASPLREQEQAEIETQQNIAHLHHQREQGLIRLAQLVAVPPVEFTLAPGGNPFASEPKSPIDSPEAVMERRPDVQSAWQRLLMSNANAAVDDGDDTPSLVQIEQADALPSTRDALYRKSVMLALQDVELAMVSLRNARSDLKTSRDTLEIQSAQLANTQNAVNAGKLSRVELLKAQLAENTAQDTAIQAAHARSVAYAALQLALARE